MAFDGHPGWRGKIFWKIDADTSASPLGIREGPGEFKKPIGFDSNVVVDEGEGVALGFADAAIESEGFALLGLEDVTKVDGIAATKFFGDGTGLVLGIVVDDEDVPVHRLGHLGGRETIESQLEALRAVVGAEDDGDVHGAMSPE